MLLLLFSSANEKKPGTSEIYQITTAGVASANISPFSSPSFETLKTRKQSNHMRSESG
jgi:hypothetical protein